MNSEDYYESCIYIIFRWKNKDLKVGKYKDFLNGEIQFLVKQNGSFGCLKFISKVLFLLKTQLSRNLFCSQISAETRFIFFSKLTWVEIYFLLKTHQSWDFFSFQNSHELRIIFSSKLIWVETYFLVWVESSFKYEKQKNDISQRKVELWFRIKFLFSNTFIHEHIKLFT